ncbi:hypothetical protein BUZ62_04630 [Staphylococcus pasteuri]|uniref:LPXTG cell wall anchor domain-containing protein n=1 Tax=Staphylococcus pasteuri TaxID=45972 RepID=UPI000D37ED6C|nr:hypothetical protein BUZ62_04630 [Staphylococcus pasteuri]
MARLNSFLKFFTYRSEGSNPEKPNNLEQSNNSNNSDDHKNQLPNTGKTDQNSEKTLVGSILAIMGSLFVFDRRKNKRNSEK